jgi:biopolymer transport protein ExbD
VIKSRMQRRKSRQRHGVPGLNLVSMIDVLSILMFFLLATAGQVPLLELMPELELPVSAAEAPPDNYVVVSIDERGVHVGKQRVLAMADLLRGNADGSDVMPALRDALLAARAAHPVQAGDEANKPVTILGDRTIPYTALKRVMASVQAADFREVQLAIDRPSTATGKDGGAATASAVSGGGKAS